MKKQFNLSRTAYSVEWHNCLHHLVIHMMMMILSVNYVITVITSTFLREIPFWLLFATCIAQTNCDGKHEFNTAVAFISELERKPKTDRNVVFMFIWLVVNVWKYVLLVISGHRCDIMGRCEWVWCVSTEGSQKGDHTSDFLKPEGCHCYQVGW